MKQYVVIGCGRFGKNLALKLSELDQEVLAIDINEDIINDIGQYVTHAVVADVTTEGVLHDLGVQNFDVVIIGITGNFEASILVAAVVKKMGIKTIIAKAKDTLHGEIMMQIGADKVIIPEKESGIRLANNLTKRSVIDFMEVSKVFSIMEIQTPKKWANKELGKLNIRKNFKINIVGIVRKDETVIDFEQNYVLEESDILLIIGKTEDIEDLIKIANA